LSVAETARRTLTGARCAVATPNRLGNRELLTVVESSTSRPVPLRGRECPTHESELTEP
jgi:hypothetical protein